MARVKITKIPKALSGLEVKMSAGLYGKPTNGNRQFTLPNQIMSQKFAQEPTTVRNTLQPVAREGANLEAEKGETAVMSLGGLPAHFKIGGKRHSQGGTPLNLPDNSFIFSDTAKMKIKDPIIIAQFGMVPKKAGYTPAEIAKKFDINKFRQILADPNSEDLQRKTAEAMISNYNLKLAKLALIQESMKGFPQGIPAIAMPYIIENDIDPSTYLPTQSQEEEPDADTGEARYGGNMVAQFNTKRYGGLPTAQVGKINKPTPVTAQQLTPGFTGSAMTSANLPLQINQEDLEYTKPGVLNDLADLSLAALEAPQRAIMYAGTGIFGDKARYEMPSETILRNYPQANPALTFAADLVSPGLVAGAVRTGSRIGIQALTKSISKQASKDAIKHVTQEGFKKGTSKLVVNPTTAEKLLKSAGREVNAKNLAIVEKTYKETANKAVDLLIKKPVLKKQTSKLIDRLDPVALKTGSKESIKQTAKILPEVIGEKTTKIAKAINKKVKEYSPVLADKLEDIAYTTKKYGQVASPLKASGAKQILGVTQKDDSPFKKVGIDSDGKTELYIHPQDPNRLYYLDKVEGRYKVKPIVITPERSTQQQTNEQIQLMNDYIQAQKESVQEQPVVKDVEVKKKPAAKAVTDVEEVKTSSSRKPLHNWD